VSGTVSGGLGFPTGSTSDVLGVGARFGLGVTWFPSPKAPVGLRLEGSYSWYGGHDHYYYDQYYNHGYADVYGADLDLELNLNHQSDSRLYVIGGLGEYRATFYRNQYAGYSCGFYYCGPGYVSTVSSGTSDWHGSWNIGLGWEFAVSPGSALYVEARYMQSISSNINLDFLPITVGYRF
jgi:Outer membrane protein beta-barrel domain